MSSDRPNKPQYAKTRPKCARCGLIADDMAGDPPVCSDPQRCENVKAGRPLGGKSWGPIKKWDVDDLPEPPPPNYQGEKPPPKKLDDGKNGAPT